MNGGREGKLGGLVRVSSGASLGEVHAKLEGALGKQGIT